LKLGAFFTTAQYSFANDAMGLRFSVLRVIIIIVFLNHIMACCWYGMGTLRLGTDTWIDDLQEEALLYRYTTSLHWSICQFGVGTFNGFDAENTGERAFCVGVLFFALLAFSSLVSSVTTAMSRLDNSSDRQKHVAHFRRYCQENHISPLLMKRMMQSLSFSLDQQCRSIAAADVMLLKLLPGPLYDELQKEIYEQFLDIHPLFRVLFHTDPVGMGMICSMALSKAYLASNDVIMHPAQVCSSTYFVDTGFLAYSRHDDEKIEVSGKTWFCEAGLWTHWMTCGAMIATSPCEMATINCEQFGEALCLRFDAFPKARRYAVDYVTMLNNTDQEELTDLCTPLTNFATLETVQEATRSLADLSEALENKTRTQKFWHRIYLLRRRFRKWGTATLAWCQRRRGVAS